MAINSYNNTSSLWIRVQRGVRSHPWIPPRSATDRVKHEENKVNVEPKVFFSCQLIYSANIKPSPCSSKVCLSFHMSWWWTWTHTIYRYNNDTTSFLWKMTKYYCPVPLLLFQVHFQIQIQNYELQRLTACQCLQHLVLSPDPTLYHLQGEMFWWTKYTFMG